MATGMNAADAAPFTLRRAGGELAAGAAALERDLDKADLKAVLAKGNRTLARKKTTGAFGGMRPKPVDWYCFENGDDTTADWYPQGVTSSSDAGYATPAFAVSWYWRPAGGERGARVSFLNPESLCYQHALLVTARADGSFGPVNIHAGGIAWYGDLLYVADTTRGLRVFDMRLILDMKTGRDDLGDADRIGRHDGAAHAFGYRYIMPQVDTWRVTAGAARFSYASVDRGADGDMLVSGEYVDQAGKIGRVARWPLAGDGTLVNADGTATAADAFQVHHQKIQGALCHEDRWYFSQSAGADAHGRLIVTRPGEKPAIRDFPIGPEDLTCWREKGTLWSVTEFRGRRSLFGVPL
ncbi:hypothetical protein [Streptosporangium sp. KLBMP 9127]|nr:hypothetical protein [Streptosporangium sp. KLBMP 9127]